MMGAIARVLRSEGLASAIRRGRDRIGEALHLRALLARGAFVNTAGAPLLNVLAVPPSARLGGVQTQLMARLAEERRLRDVALLYPGVLELSSHAWRAPSFAATTVLVDEAFERAVEHAMARTGARAIHLEGTAGIPIGSVLRLANQGIVVILGVHDFSLFCARPNLLEEPAGVFCDYSIDADRCNRCLRQTWSVDRDEQASRRAAARQLLERARAIVFPSGFMRERHRTLFALPDLAGHVIEPGVSGGSVARGHSNTRSGVAFVGSVKRHKGGHLLPEIIGGFGGADVDWHLFGGGDEALLRAVRLLPRVTVHGYYRRGTLPSLLARHDIGLALLPSIVPESYGLTLSECWRAGVPAVAFARGALAERIGRRGGGWLVPPEEGAGGIARVVRRWLDGEVVTVPVEIATPRDAAIAHVALYREMGLVR